MISNCHLKKKEERRVDTYVLLFWQFCYLPVMKQVTLLPREWSSLNIHFMVADSRRVCSTRSKIVEGWWEIRPWKQNNKKDCYCCILKVKNNVKMLTKRVNNVSKTSLSRPRRCPGDDVTMGLNRRIAWEGGWSEWVRFRDTHAAQNIRSLYNASVFNVQSR